MLNWSFKIGNMECKRENIFSITCKLSRTFSYMGASSAKSVYSFQPSTAVAATDKTNVKPSAAFDAILKNFAYLDFATNSSSFLARAISVVSPSILRSKEKKRNNENNRSGSSLYGTP